MKTWFANARRKLKDSACYKEEEEEFEGSDTPPRNTQSVISRTCNTNEVACLEGEILADQMPEEEAMRRHFEARGRVPVFSELAEPRVNVVPPLKLPHGMNSGRTAVMLSWFREGFSIPSSISRYDNSDFCRPLRGIKLIFEDYYSVHIPTVSSYFLDIFATSRVLKFK